MVENRPNVWHFVVKNVYESMFSVSIYNCSIGQQKHILFEQKNLFENGTKRQVRKPFKLIY